MKYTYIASDNTAANGVALSDTAGRDIEVYKIFIGTPADGKVLTLYDITNPVNGATTNIAFKLTQPTAAAGKEYTKVVDFTKPRGGNSEGLRLGGGGAVIYNGSDATILWDYVE